MAQDLREMLPQYVSGFRKFKGRPAELSEQQRKALSLVESGALSLEEISSAITGSGFPLPYVAVFGYQAGLGHSIIADAYWAQAGELGIPAGKWDLIDEHAHDLEKVMGCSSDEKGAVERIGELIYHVASNGPTPMGAFLSAGIRMSARRVKDDFSKYLDEAEAKAEEIASGRPLVVLGTHPAPGLLLLEERENRGYQIPLATLVPDNLSRRSVFGESPVRRGFLPKELDSEIVLVPDSGEKAGYSRLGVDSWGMGYPNHPEIVRLASAMPEGQSNNVTFIMGGSGTNGDLLLESARKTAERDPGAEIAIYCAFNEDFFNEASREFPGASRFYNGESVGSPSNGKYGNFSIYGFSSDERTAGIETANRLMANSGVLVTKSGERPRSKTGQENTGGEKAVIIIGHDEGGQERTLRKHYLSHFAVSAEKEAREYFGKAPRSRAEQVEMESEIVAEYAGDPSWRRLALENSWREIRNEGGTAKKGLAAAFIGAIPLYSNPEKVYSSLGV